MERLTGLTTASTLYDNYIMPVDDNSFSDVKKVSLSDVKNYIGTTDVSLYYTGGTLYTNNLSIISLSGHSGNLVVLNSDGLLSYTGVTTNTNKLSDLIDVNINNPQYGNYLIFSSTTWKNTNEILTDNINELTQYSGVTIDGVLIKDGIYGYSNNIYAQAQANGYNSTNGTQLTAMFNKIVTGGSGDSVILPVNPILGQVCYVVNTTFGYNNSGYINVWGNSGQTAIIVQDNFNWNVSVVQCPEKQCFMFTYITNNVWMVEIRNLLPTIPFSTMDGTNGNFLTYSASTRTWYGYTPYKTNTSYTGLTTAQLNTLYPNTNIGFLTLCNNSDVAYIKTSNTTWSLIRMKDDDTLVATVTSGTGGPSTYPFLNYDINNVIGNGYAYLPSGVTAGKTLIVKNGSSAIGVEGYNGDMIIQMSNNSSVSQVNISAQQTYRFTYIGNGYWFSEYVEGTKFLLNNFSDVLNNVTITVTNSTYTGLTISQLNSIYSNTSYPIGLNVICANSNISYIKTGAATWSAYKIQNLLNYSGGSQVETKPEYKEYRVKIYQSGSTNAGAPYCTATYVDEISSSNDTTNALYREIIYAKVTGGTYTIQIKWLKTGNPNLSGKTSINSIGDAQLVDISTSDSNIRFNDTSSISSDSTFSWIIITFKSYSPGVSIPEDNIIQGSKIYIRLYDSFM